MQDKKVTALELEGSVLNGTNLRTVWDDYSGKEGSFSHLTRIYTVFQKKGLSVSDFVPDESTVKNRPFYSGNP